ncbi:MAG TPA: dienelactone hydrolase family protein [Thermoanaerobaculia bacterium]
MIEFAGGVAETVPGYLSRPKAEEPHPGIVLIHDLFGLLEHTRDVANRLAREGYVVLAPNLFAAKELANVLTAENVQKAMRLLFRLPRRDPELARAELAKLPDAERAVVGPTVEKLLGGLPKDRFTKDLVASVAHLRSLPFVRADRIGSLGFCFGGGMSASLACEAKIRACVVFYGENPSPIERVRNLEGPFLGLYGGDDARINADLDRLVRAMVEYKKDFELRIYPGAPHAFFNDTNTTTYRDAAAKDAWDRVVRFYARTLMA